jgi:hypothetical protein
MKKTTLKSIIVPFIVLAIIAVSMSSCQRGYGCSYGLSSKTHVRK